MKANSNSFVITAYCYEHNDGDQIWEDLTEYRIKADKDEIFKVYKDGCSGKESITSSSLSEMIKEYKYVEERINPSERGGYDITNELSEIQLDAINDCNYSGLREASKLGLFAPRPNDIVYINDVSGTAQCYEIEMNDDGMRRFKSALALYIDAIDVKDGNYFLLIPNNAEAADSPSFLNLLRCQDFTIQFEDKSGRIISIPDKCLGSPAEKYIKSYISTVADSAKRNAEYMYSEDNPNFWAYVQLIESMIETGLLQRDPENERNVILYRAGLDPKIYNGQTEGYFSQEIADTANEVKYEYQFNGDTSLFDALDEEGIQAVFDSKGNFIELKSVHESEKRRKNNESRDM